MLTVFQSCNHMLGMARCIGRYEDCLNIVILDHLFEGGVFLIALRFLRKPFTPVGEKVGHRNNFNIRMILEVELAGELTKPEPGKADTDFTVSVHLPDFGTVRFDKMFKSFDLVKFLAVKSSQT